MPHAVEGGLGRLIRAEARLAEAVAAAEAEAAELLEAARVAAGAKAAASGRALQADLAALADRLAAARDAEISAVLCAAEDRCRRLRDLPAAASDELAAWVAAQVLDDPAGDVPA